jgi:hypothetical protein
MDEQISGRGNGQKCSICGEKKQGQPCERGRDCEQVFDWKHRRREPPTQYLRQPMERWRPFLGREFGIGETRENLDHTGYRDGH